MAAQPASPARWEGILKIAGWIGFAVTVVLFLFVSARAGMRWMGLGVIAAAIGALVTRRIPYGWEGQAPVGHITGVLAVILGVLFGGVGLAMLFRPDMMLYIFGWAE